MKGAVWETQLATWNLSIISEFFVVRVKQKKKTCVEMNDPSTVLIHYPGKQNNIEGI
jgi:hypothetical protein